MSRSTTSILPPAFGDFDDVAALVGVGERLAREILRRPDAPKRIRLSDRVAVFDLAEVMAWIRALPRESGPATVPKQLVRGRRVA